MIRAFSILVFYAAASVTAMAQFNIAPGGKSHPLGKDTLCFRYDFRAGDTLRYGIEAHDSVNIERGQSFSKTRKEVLQIACDSVSISGLMHLTFSLVSAAEIHVSGKDTTRRTSSPWKNRKQHVTIDALGHRRAFSNDNDTVAGVSPGGTFPPMWLPIIDTSCGRQNQSWLSSDTVVLVENAVPNPVVIQQNFWRVLDRLDTLGRKTSVLQYTQTGVGAVTMNSRDVKIDVKAILAGYGRLAFDRRWNVIIHQFATVENRFTMTLPGGSLVNGKHWIRENITLLKLISTDPKRSWQGATKR
ncbi:MAG: hypothetical protein NTX15_05880 [Candidatus Kapabacteria bacterium]|nr:hypothetical protein [Candidatus Kapabacteria bacterium]